MIIRENKIGRFNYLISAIKNIIKQKNENTNIDNRDKIDKIE